MVPSIKPYSKIQRLVARISQLEYFAYAGKETVQQFMGTGPIDMSGNFQNTPAALSPELYEIRRRFTHSPWNMLAFQHIDSIFYTAPVIASGSPWKIPRAERPLDFNYEFDGAEYPAHTFAERTFTNALLIAKDGTIVHESYRNLSSSSTRFLSMSTAKSITSILVGIAVQDNSIHSLDDQITDYIPELQDTAYAGATVRHLLLMKSGLDRDETYTGPPDSEWAKARERGMIKNEQRSIDRASEFPRMAEPGTRFNYSTLDTVVLGQVLRRATGKPLSDFMSERLWQPLGAEADGYWMLDGPPGIGFENNGMGFNAALRDFGRVGLLMLNQGKANGNQIITSEWVKESTVATGAVPVSPDRSYGYQYQWWTFADSNAYMAIGLQGQFIFIDPDTRTVIVKLSYFPMEERDELMRHSDAFFRSASAWAG